MTGLVDLLRESVAGRPEQPTLDDLLAETRAALKALVEEGALKLGDDHRLTGEALEIRVRQLLLQAGLETADGRPGLEDFVVAAPPGAPTQFPLVLEVKSSRKPQVSRDDLRQLDDWVFDLSKEGDARKRGLGGGIDPLAILTRGLHTHARRHPSPHKGVLVVNAPSGTPFELRADSCLSPNDAEFVDKRNFCVMPLSVLVRYREAIAEGKCALLEFWELVHSTCGILGFTAT